MTPERLDGIAHFGRLRIAPWRNDMQADRLELPIRQQRQQLAASQQFTDFRLRLQRHAHTRQGELTRGQDVDAADARLQPQALLYSTGAKQGQVLAALQMQADPVELEQLRRLEGIVGSHFERFAWQEELTLDWQPI